VPATDKLKEQLVNFKEFIDIARGHKDVKTRVEVLANPDNLNTMSNLTKNQARFIANAEFLDNRSWGSMFEGLKDFAESIREPAISVRGEGREQAIRFMGALNESKLLSKLGITAAGDQKKE
jgi:hypothetical protein